MVQQFLQIKLRIRSSQTQPNLASNIARWLGKNYTTIHNIVQWEKLWIVYREMPRRKNCEDYAIWMDNEELKESIRDFTTKKKETNLEFLRFK